MQYLFWALVGWCGTPWPRPWPWPPPGPDPDPWILKVVGVVGGVVGGLAFTKSGIAGTGDAMIAGAIGAWVGANILVNAYGLVAGSKKAG